MYEKGQQKIRVLLGKPGLDPHDRGVKIIARALRDAGMEVIYLGLRVTTRQVVETAIQEDVAVVGLSNLSSAHIPMTREVLDLLQQRGIDDVLLVLGGVFHPEDLAKLKEMGVTGCFGPGTHTDEVVRFIRENVRHN